MGRVLICCLGTPLFHCTEYIVNHTTPEWLFSNRHDSSTSRSKPSMALAEVCDTAQLGPCLLLYLIFFRDSRFLLAK